MKNLTLTLVSLVLLSSVLFSCSKEDDGIYFNENTEEINTTNVTYSAIETEILNLVNEHRISINLSALSTLNTISGVADGHTNYMIAVDKVSHDNFSQRSQTLINEVKAKSVGENVAYGYTTAQGVVNGWLNSEGHRKIIENPDYTHFGISTDANSAHRNYFTQIFIKK